MSSNKSSVFIDHVLGEVFVERGKEKKEVNAKLTSESGSFHLEDGDKIVTGKDGYVASTAEREKGKYSSSFKVGCNSEILLNISTTTSKIKVGKGWIVVETNAKIEAPLVEIKRASGENTEKNNSMFVLIKVEQERVKIANKGLPINVIHKKTGEEVQLTGHEQATATPSDLNLKSDADQDVRSILSKFMELNESLANSVTDKVQENMEELKKEMKKMGVWEEIEGDE